MFHFHWGVGFFLVIRWSLDVTGYCFVKRLHIRAHGCYLSRHTPPIRDPRGSLIMHFGHSHSHSHTHNQRSPLHRDSENSHSPSIITSHKGWRDRISHLFKHFIISKRTKISIVFAAMVTFLPSLLLERKLQKTQVGLFLATLTSLVLFNQVKETVRDLSRRVKLLKDSIAKHSPKQPLWTASYFSQSNNSADRVTLLGIAINIILSAGKALVGIQCHSTALIADAGHSLSDLFSDFITLWAVQISRIPADDDHPYGHGKFEAVGSLFLALTLLATGIGVGAVSSENLMRIITAQRTSGIHAAAHILHDAVPTPPALFMAFVSIVSKEWLYRVTRKVGEELRSQVVIANAWHHRSDAYSSVLALISISLAIAFPGLIAADSAAGLLVAGIICVTGFEIMGESVRQLTDTNDEELVQQVRAITLGESEDVVQIKRLRTRRMGSSSIVDMEIYCSPSLSASALRTVEQRVRFKVMYEVPGVIDCEIHASSLDAVSCPLLTATELKSNSMASPHEIEDTAKAILQKHPEVHSVESCRVHYQDTIFANVDATIRLKDPEKLSISSAISTAKKLRETLELSQLIHKANIFLDLNEGATLMST